MIENMNAIVIQAVEKVELTECIKPCAGPYEVLIQVKSVSLCTVEQRTYLGIKKFPFPFVGGHEGSGVIAEVGENVSAFQLGDHVVFDFVYCGQCDNCKLGYSTQCTGIGGAKPTFAFGGTVLGGALAEYIVVPWVNVSKISPDVSFDTAALTEPLSCCLHSVNKTRLTFGETVVVVGAGFMGLLQAALCRMRGARVIVSEPDAARREKAVAIGAHIAIDPIASDPVEQIRTLTGGRGADVVINTTPITAVWKQAIGMLARRGRLIAYSSQHPDDPVDIHFGSMHSKEIEFIGTVNPGAEDFVMAARMLSYGLIDLGPLIDSVYPASRAEEAFRRAVCPDSYRVVIRHGE